MVTHGPDLGRMKKPPGTKEDQDLTKTSPLHLPSQLRVHKVLTIRKTTLCVRDFSERSKKQSLQNRQNQGRTETNGVIQEEQSI